MTQDSWLDGPPDFVAPPEAVFDDLSGVGATLFGVPIVHAGHQLAYDLEAAGYRTEEQLHRAIAEIVDVAVDSSHPDDIGYPIFEAVIAIGDGQAERVWIEQFDDKAAIYYPRAR